MATTKQVNVRVPPSAQELILRIASRLREDPHFGGRLERWLGEQGDPSAGPLLSERVDRLERRVDALEGRGAARGVPGIPHAPERTPSSAPPDSPSLFGGDDATPRGWTIGEGRGRRLTAEGEAELARLIRAGRTDTEIARTLDVKPNTVANRRKALAAHPTEG